MPIMNAKTGCLVAGAVRGEPVYRSDVGHGLLKLNVRYDSVKDDDTGKWVNKYLTVEIWGEQAAKMRGVINDGDIVIAMGRLNESEYNGKKYYAVKTNGEVFLGASVLPILADAIAGGSQKLEVPVSSDADDDFREVAGDDADLPF